MNLSPQGKWESYKPEQFKVPKNFDIATKFPQMLIPTLDSVRANNLMETILFSKTDDEAAFEAKKNVLIIGDGGTAKSSTVILFCNKNSDQMLIKKTNFSSATTPFLLQMTIEGELVSKGSK
jgi:dynein heavy chain